MGTKRGRVQASSGPHLGKVYTNRLDLVAGSSLKISAAISFPDVGGASPMTGPSSRHATWANSMPTLSVLLLLSISSGTDLYDFIHEL